MPLTGQTLIFDADDTLWENNLLFERVIEDFLVWLDHPSMEPAQLRAVLDDIELANTVAHGYGSTVFLRSLRDCFASLNQRPADAAEEREIEHLAIALLEHRVELMPGVADTLSELGARNELHLMTKGALDEQQAKIDASGLAAHFATTSIVREKDTEAYLALTERLGCDPARAWMIGNSPKSDILPARRAGLNAVLIPNANTWRLEHDELDPDDTAVLQLASFTSLRDHF